MSSLLQQDMDERSIISLDDLDHTGDANPIFSPRTPSTNLHVFMDSFQSETRYPLALRHPFKGNGGSDVKEIPGDGQFLLRVCSPTTPRESMSLNDMLMRARNSQIRGMLAEPMGVDLERQRRRGQCAEDDVVPWSLGDLDTDFELKQQGRVATSKNPQQFDAATNASEDSSIDHSLEQKPLMDNTAEIAPSLKTSVSFCRRRKFTEHRTKRSGLSSALSDVSSLTWDDSSSVYTDCSTDQVRSAHIPMSVSSPELGRRLTRQETKLECDLDSALLYSFSDSPPKSPQRRGSLRSSSSLTPSADATVESKRLCRHDSWLLSDPPPLWVVNAVRHRELGRNVQ